jgi:hypothetical protein
MTASTRRLAALAVLTLGTLASAGAAAIELRGFRGVPWGAGIDSLGPSQLAYRSGEVSCYRRERENMLYGDSPVKDIRYCFNRERLFMVALDADVALDVLVREFEGTYGPPDWRLPAKTGWGDHATRVRVEMVAAAEGGSSMLMHSNEHEPRTRTKRKAGD